MESKTDFVGLRKALISTFDKTDLLPLCNLLIQSNVEIISTGNTRRFLQSHHIPVTDVEAVTQFPEILDGRVKTLHPNIFSGLLARRHLPSHLATLAAHDIDPIDLVVVNLYPFEKAISSLGATESDCIENIDIGGPSLIRAAAKNFEHVAVLCDPSQYADFMSRFSNAKATSMADRRRWAADAFARTAQYDRDISNWFDSKPLRYGENPHQKARVIASNRDEILLAATLPLQGKELSYNNLLDAHAAILSLRCLMTGTDKTDTGCVIVKHGTPCGAALAHEMSEAVSRAFASDPISAFGGIVSFSAPVDEQTAAVLKAHFIEVVIAPAFSEQALEILSHKKDLRVLQIPVLISGEWPKESMRSIFGGYLVQDFDIPDAASNKLEVVSQKEPSSRELSDLSIANRLVIPCLSNAITIVRDGQLIGVGAGQTSRIDAVKLAIAKAIEHGHSLAGAVLASDGFFPFADSLQAAKDSGITAVIQPGGSKRDAEVIAKANELGLAMVFTHTRHFRH